MPRTPYPVRSRLPIHVLAEILTANLHPKIDVAWASALANDVRARAKAYVKSA
jgi:hypothetical protein